MFKLTAVGIICSLVIGMSVQGSSAAPCREGMRNSTTLNPLNPNVGSFWIAKRDSSDNSITVYLNGSAPVFFPAFPIVQTS